MLYANAFQSDPAQTVPAAPASGDLLACVRARGRLNVTAVARGEQTFRAGVFESGSLRVRFPREHMARLDATVVNVAGGMTGGDRFDMRFATGAGAQLFVSSAAAEKICRSSGAPTHISVQLSAGENSFCAWLPQESILFNAARLVRTLDADIAADAQFLACEMTILGRAAMGERVHDIAWSERWRIRRAGRLVMAEDTRMNGDAARHLAGRPTGAGAHAFATLVYAGVHADAYCLAMRELLNGAGNGCETGVSSFDGLLIARFVAQDGQSLRAAVVQCINAINGLRLPRGWYT